MIKTTTPFEEIVIGDVLPDPLDLTGREYPFVVMSNKRINYPTARQWVDRTGRARTPENKYGVVVYKHLNHMTMVALYNERWWYIQFEEKV